MSKTARPPSYSAIQQKIGERMQWVRELTIPNRAECARLMGVDTSTLKKVESGDRAPSVFLVMAYAGRLRASTEFFLRGVLTGLDPELSNKLCALHPQLVLGQEDMDTGPPDTAPAIGKSLRTTRREKVSVTS